MTSNHYSLELDTKAWVSGRGAPAGGARKIPSADNMGPVNNWWYNWHFSKQTRLESTGTSPVIRFGIMEIDDVLTELHLLPLAVNLTSMGDHSERFLNTLWDFVWELLVGELVLWVVHEILLTTQRPNSFFHFWNWLELGLWTRTWPWACQND